MPRKKVDATHHHIPLYQLLWGIILFIVVLPPSFMVHSAHILFYHNVASYSHRVGTYILADALAKGGHQVTFISPFRHRGGYINPNITEIVPRAVEKTMQDFLDQLDINHRIQKTFERVVFACYPTGITACQDLYDSPELAEFYNRTSTLHAVITDNFMADCGVAIAYKYGAKHIIFSTTTHLGNEFDQFGFQPESSSIPEFEINPPIPPMTFYERVVNALISIHFRWEHYKFVTTVDDMARSHLKDPSMPFLDDLMRNASLVLYTGDVVTDHPRSHAPLFVDIGGIYCKNSSNELPAALTKFIEEDPHSKGLVYISLGTLAISSNLPENVKQTFMETIRLFPELRFIWKWDSPIPSNKPNNLYLGKWLPQTDILAHPKMRAFVSQCGRPSTVEALCNDVPMIAFPVLGDQDNNANRMNKMGANIKLELGTVTTKEFVEALREIVYNKRFRERVSELRTIVLDRPMSALDTAVWWTEYVLRHKDTIHLRPSGFDQWWYERRLLDVWAFLFTFIFATFIILPIFIFLFCKKRIFRGKQISKKTKTK